MADAAPIAVAARALGISVRALRRDLAAGAPVLRRGARGRGRTALLDVDAIAAWRRSRDGTDRLLVLAAEVPVLVADAMHEAFALVDGPHKRAARRGHRWFSASRAHGEFKRIAEASTEFAFIDEISRCLYIKPGMSPERNTYGPNDVKPGDWIKYQSGHYGSGRLAEVHALGADARSGPFAVTTEGEVLFSRILEIRRRPINVLVMERQPRK